MNGSKPFGPLGHPPALATMGTRPAVGSSAFPSPNDHQLAGCDSVARRHMPALHTKGLEASGSAVQTLEAWLPSAQCREVIQR